MLLLNKKDMQKVFTMRDAVAADKQAFRIYSAGGSVVPLRVNIGVPAYEGQTLFMPGYVRDLDSMGVKVVSVFPRNSEKGLPSVPATMVLIDGASGQVCCLLDGTYLTQLRTGAAAGAATDLLARQDARVGALIGTGGQAAAQLEAMLSVRKLQEVRILGRDQEHTRSFVEQRQAEFVNFGTVLRAVETPEEAVTGADLVYTDVWTSMGQEEQAKQRIAQMKPYAVTAKLFAAAKPDALFMHCLPAHPGEEVEQAVLDNPRCVIFDEAENRLHVQKAIMAALAEARLK